MAARRWTSEQRRQQAERIRAWSPWTQSTGPRSAEGKAVASRNAWKGGHRQMLRELSRAMNEHWQDAAELAKSWLSARGV